MVAKTDIKFYVHTNNNAPQLQNAYGSMINVLDACLVNGINIGSISSLTAAGVKVTATFGATHNLKQYQVIKITGAAQPEFNGEHRILTVPSSTLITFELAATPTVTTATGIISCSLPPLGWTLPFSTAGKRAYKNKEDGSPFLRVVDMLDPAWTSTYTKYAKVGICENMIDIDSMTGHQAPYDPTNPNKNWVGTGLGTTAFNGWAKWLYATNSPETDTSTKTPTPMNGDRSWVIVGNSETFYIFNKSNPNVNNAHIAQGFGKLVNLSKINASPYFLIARDDYTQANQSLYIGYSPLTMNAAQSGGFMLRGYKNEAVLTPLASKIFNGTVSEYCGFSNAFATPSADIAVFSSEYIFTEGGNIPRGVVPILRWLHNRLPYTHLQAIQENGSMLLACSCVSNNYEGQILIDLGRI